jgi:hypothetical protein
MLNHEWQLLVTLWIQKHFRERIKFTFEQQNLIDGGQFSLVEERTPIHCMMYLGRDHRPSAGKLTNCLTQSHRSEQDSN